MKHVGLKLLGLLVHAWSLLPHFAVYTLQGEFSCQVMRIREQAAAREEDRAGGRVVYTEERMQSDLGYSKCLGADLLVVWRRSFVGC